MIDLSSIKINKPREILNFSESVSTHNNGGAIVNGVQYCSLWESKPKIRTIRFENKVQFRLGFPYVQYYCSYQRYEHGFSEPVTLYPALYVTFSNKPVKDENTPVFYPPLSCIIDGYVCGLHERTMEKIIPEFWHSEFRIDYDDDYDGSAYVRQLFGKDRWKAWEERTILEPNFAVSFNWLNKDNKLKSYFKKST